MKIGGKFKGLSEDLLRSSYDVRINTRGSSMFPLIRTRDKITISPEKNPDIGDIIVFKRNDQMVCHRLVKVFERDGARYFQTRGDTHFSLDEPVLAAQILGKVTRIERGNVSLMRRILLFVYPVLRFGRLNATLISALIMVRNVLTGKKSG